MSTMIEKSRREERRQETVQEILELAWDQIASEGAANLSLRAISREMRMSSPAIFRYFDSRDALLSALSLDANRDMNRHLVEARDAVDASRPITRLIAVCRAYREWALANPAKFSLAYSTPIPGKQPKWEQLQSEAQRTLEIFIEIILQTISSRDITLSPEPVFWVTGAREQIDAIIGSRGYQVSSERLYIALAGWTRLFGFITLEINQQVQPILADPSVFYDNEIHQLLRLLGCNASAG